MSTETRPYRLRARAERQAETRRRIVAAAAALHEEVGPARTTIAEIARRAGVERLTVYNHFPGPSALFRACQGHFLAAHPPPDLAPRGRGGAVDRLEQVLVEVYGWYRANQALERHVNRDRRLVPELDGLLRETADQHFGAAAAAYGELIGTSPQAAVAVRRLVGVAFDFATWDRLAADGAGDAEIARLFRRSVEALRRPRP